MNITIDLSQIDRNKITERTYQTKDGTVKTSKDYRIVAIPLKEALVIKEGETWIAKKTHFIADDISKEARENGEKGAIFGSVVQFFDKDIAPPSTDDINPEDIPF